MTQANLLLLNIGATFARMAVTVVMGLWTTRIAYRELGPEAFGAYAAGLSVVAFLMLLVGAVGNSAERHVAYAIGAGDREGVRRTTGATVSLMLLMAAVIGGGIALLAPWLAAPLVAPEPYKSQLPATIAWIGGLTAAVVATSPYRSFLVARQSIVMISVFEVLESVGRVVAVSLLAANPGASLNDYARWVCMCAATPFAVLVVYCVIRHPESRPARLRGLRGLTGFAGWLLVNSFGWKLRTDGVQVLVNLTAGAALSASYSVCNQVAMYQNNISSAIYRVLRPAIVNAQGASSPTQVRRLAQACNKLMGLSNLYLLVPVVFETRSLLTLWIGGASDEMVTMVRLLVTWISLRDLTVGHELAVHGQGRVARHEVATILIDILSLALGVAAVVGGAPVWTLVLAVNFAIVGHMLLRVLAFGGAANVTPTEWGREVLLRYLAVMASSASAAAVVLAVASPGVERTVAVIVVTAAATTLAIFAFGLDSGERAFLWGAVRGLRRRLGGLSRSP